MKKCKESLKNEMGFKKKEYLKCFHIHYVLEFLYPVRVNSRKFVTAIESIFPGTVLHQVPVGIMVIWICLLNSIFLFDFFIF